ncbi:MAG: SDR family oxidoreductase [Pseudomonadota bacterium]|nr:SDR family oxidoreductase [Pseudomonadota bacterium]
MKDARIALVTGSSRGIGAAIAQRLGADGMFVIVHYNGNREAADATLAKVQAAGGDGTVLQGDLSDPQAPGVLAQSVHDLTRDRFGSPRLDVLVNNAGLGVRCTIEETTDAMLDETLEVDFKAPFKLIRSLGAIIPEGGRIINISSMGTRVAYPDMAAYAPAKAALEALGVLLAAHFGPRGITVNSVLPGATVTDLSGPMRNPEWIEKTSATIAMRRLGQPDDIAEVVAFLAGTQSGWITAQKIDASGGQRI